MAHGSLWFLAVDTPRLAPFEGRRETRADATGRLAWMEKMTFTCVRNYTDINKCRDAEAEMHKNGGGVLERGGVENLKC